MEAENLPGQLHLKYEAEVQKAQSTTAEDRQAFTTLDSESIRRGKLILIKESTDKDLIPNIKTETARRIGVFTEGQEDESYQKNKLYTLNYQRVKEEFETSIGLGEILLDPDIKTIKVLQNGETIIATRGKVQHGRHAGRIGFTKPDGSYLATFTGDKFVILDNNGILPTSSEEEKRNYIERFKKEQNEREEFNKTSEFSNTKSDTYSSIETQNASALEGNEINIDNIKELNNRQKNIAKIIESQFKKRLLDTANLPPKVLQLTGPNGFSADVINKITLAAIINAKHESGLNPEIAGDGGNSIGLFQLHSKGAGRNLTVEYRQDPINNINTIIDREVFNIARPGVNFGGRNLIERALAGASVKELTQIFARDIERPLDKPRAMRLRGATADRWLRQEIKRSYTNETINTPQGFRLNYQNQPTLIAGSSTVGQIPAETKFGTFYKNGISANNLQNALQGLWESKNLSEVKTVVIVGAAFNSLNSGQNPETVLNQYQQIATYLKNKGISAKFTTIQETGGANNNQRLKNNATIFNRLLRQAANSEKLELIDTSKAIYNDKVALAGEIANVHQSDGIHFSAPAMGDFIDVVNQNI